MSNEDGLCESADHSEPPTPTTPSDFTKMPPLRLLLPRVPPNSPIISATSTWTPNARLAGTGGTAVIWNGVETQTLEVAAQTVSAFTPYLLGADDKGRVSFVDVRELLTEFAKMLNTQQSHAEETNAKRRRSARRAARAQTDAEKLSPQ